MCVVTAEVFNRNPSEYLLRAKKEVVTIIDEDTSFLLTPKIPNAETLAAMEEGDRLAKDTSARRYSSVEELFADMDAEIEKGGSK